MGKIIKQIDGVNVSHCNFGIRKKVLQRIASSTDIQTFIELQKTKDKIYQQDIRSNRWRQIDPINSQLRGLRKYWRNAYTDSFSEGLYTCETSLTWECGKCIGEFGTVYRGNQIEKGTLFIYVQHDRLGNVELMNTKTSGLIKITRGSSVCDKFIKYTKGENDE
jgi:hypothetical protein